MRLAAFLLLAGCATAGPDPQIAMLEGCWAEQGSGNATTLRLLPEQGAHEMAGYLLVRRDSGLTDRTRFAFAQDGSRLIVSEGQVAEVYQRQPAADVADLSGEKRMTFRRENRRRGWAWDYSLLVTSVALEINTVEINTYEAAPDMFIELKREDCG